MEARNSVPKPIWDRSLPNSIAIRKYLQQCGEFAQRLITTPDGHGLKHRLYSAADFQLKYGVAPIIYADPGPYPPGADGVAIANIKEEKQLLQLQQAMDGVLMGAVEEGYPQEIRALLEIDFTLDHLTLAQQFQQLQATLVMTAADIAWMKAQMTKAWTRDTKIETFTARQLQLHGFLTIIGQALPPLDAIQAMWRSFNSNAQDKIDFANAMLRFLDRWPELDDQTPANFAASIIGYVNNLLHAEREANMARRQANAAEEIVVYAQPVPVAAAAAVAPQQHQHQQPGRGVQQGRAAQQGRGGRGGGRGPPAVPAPLHAGQPRPYCHTHGGLPVGVRGHYSNGCPRPGPQHNWNATFDDQMGGVVAI
jgi:hypothetical protein